VTAPLHEFAVSVAWTGNRGTGTSARRGFDRTAEVRVEGLGVGRDPGVALGIPPIDVSAARAFHGDADRWNPEQLLLAALAQCHLLSYLYVCAREGVSVESYTDRVVGHLELRGETGSFVEARLRPEVVIGAGELALAESLHAEAHRLCFIANSVAFPVRIEPTVRAASR